MVICCVLSYSCLFLWLDHLMVCACLPTIKMSLCLTQSRMMLKLSGRFLMKGVLLFSLSFSIEIIYYCLEKRELQELPNFMTSWKVSGLRRVMHIVKVWLLFEACGIFLVSNRNHQAWNVWCLCLMISKDLITSRTSITQTSLNGISEHMWSVTFVKSGKFSLQYVCLY